jgi:hypothetical protein
LYATGTNYLPIVSKWFGSDPGDMLGGSKKYSGVDEKISQIEKVLEFNVFEKKNEN